MASGAGSGERAPLKPARPIGLQVKHLEALMAIAVEGSFGGAARRLGYTQSAVSQQIAALERLVGQRLVDRSKSAEPPRLGSLLVRKGLISEDQLAVALTEARASNDLVGRVLLRNQWIFEDELARVLSEQLDIPYLSIMRIGVNVEVVQLLPADVGMDVAAIPVRRRGDAIHVAFADPTDQRALESVQEHLPMIDVAVAELSDIMAAWRQVAPRR